MGDASDGAEDLAKSGGKLGPVLANRLGDLYTRVGAYHLAQGNPTNAAAAFKEALKYAPGNATAKAQLASIESGAAAAEDEEAEEEAEVAAKPAPAPRPVKRRAAIADAWQDAAEDAEAAPRKDKRVSAIEDAWND